MTGDTPADADAFLGKWRRAQRVMHRENLVNMPATNHIGLIQQMRYCAEQGMMDYDAVLEAENQFYRDDRLAMREFMKTRVSKAIQIHIKNHLPAGQDEPRSIQECIGWIEHYIEVYGGNDGHRNNRSGIRAAQSADVRHPGGTVVDTATHTHTQT